MAIGRNQGTPGSSALDPQILGLGYGIAHSSGTRTSVHYNLEVGGETALMTKERFVERYGVPLYTVGVGGSGGAIQQYVYGQNHRGLLDAGIPVVSYPDMVTQTIHVGDCELLEHYMDVTDGANPKWRTWSNRRWLIGLNASDTFPNPYTGGAPGSTECVNGWRGLLPLAMNPLFGTAGAGTERMDPAEMAAVHWTHWEDLRNIYGVGARRLRAADLGQRGRPVRPAGAARGSHHPAGVPRPQREGRQLEGPRADGAGGPPVPARSGRFDPWSARNMRLSPDGGVTPAPRRQGDLDAMRAAYRQGIYFDGDIDIPLIDARPYLEPVLDMHNSHQSFASRQRMLDFDGDASNQVIWFWDTAGGDRLMLPDGVRGRRRVAREPASPPEARRRGQPPAAGRGRVLRGVEDADRPRAGRLVGQPRRPAARTCAQRFPIRLDVAHRGGRSDPRRRLQVRVAAGRHGDRARPLRRVDAHRPTQRARLEAIFPTGVCDYRRRDQGRPAR